MKSLKIGLFAILTLSTFVSLSVPAFADGASMKSDEYAIVPPLLGIDDSTLASFETMPPAKHTTANLPHLPQFPGATRPVCNDLCVAGDTGPVTEEQAINASYMDHTQILVSGPQTVEVFSILK